MRRTRFWIITGVVVFLLLVIVPTVVGIATEVMWYGSLGFESVYWTSFFAKIAMFFGFGLLTVLVVGVNVFIARRSQLRLPAYRGQPQAARGIAAFFIWAVVAAIGVFTALSMMDGWSVVLKFITGGTFGQKDPIFGQDIGFYVFTLPFMDMLRGWAFAVVIISIIFVAVIYIARSIPNLGSILFTMSQGGRIEISNPENIKITLTSTAKTHLAALGAVLMILFAYSFWLSNYFLLFSTRGITRGASYADVNGEQYGYWVMMAVSIAVAGLILFSIRTRRKRYLLIAGASWAGVAVLAIGIFPAIIQGVIVGPNELALETPYIKYGIEATRQAFNLNNIEERSYATTDQLTYADVANNPQTSQNIRLQDYRPLQTTYGQIQEIRTYYAFNDVDIDRYTIDGKYRQVMLSARNLITSKLPAEAQTWVNQHIKYTHGFGLALSPVNEVTPEGLPSLLVKDIPPVSTSKDLKIDRPELYYGTEDAPYVFVKTSTQEFDYPKGDDNVFSTYEGTGGVPVGGFLNRAMFAIRFGDPNILLSEYLTNDSRIMFHRQVQDAVTTIAPFLQYDKDPYLVIANGRLYYIQDAYTATPNYPYSQLAGSDISYIRNSVKIVVDAYNGSMSFYIFDPTDPIIQTYQKIFPALFKPASDMPAALRAHVRYPEDMLNIQAQMYSTYHMRDPQVFYNKEDVWTLPLETFGDQQAPMQAYFIIMRAPGEKNEDFQLILPFTPAGRDNLIGWISAKSDGADYGKLLVFKFSKQSTNYGPLQIEARINQNPAISQQLTLWGQKGSNVIRGNLLVIPIGKSLLYIQPLYLQAQGGGSLPELQRVIVATGNNVVMANTLDAALTQVFGQAPPSTTQTNPTGTGAQPAQTGTVADQIKALAKSAQDHYNKAQDYLKQGDWTNYGKEMNAMKADLDKMVQLTGQ